jgi:predicted signal transduction protein with EAL and GGDEF domain
LSDVTKRKQAHLYQLAHYDALTSLPNRVLFRDRLATALRGDSTAGRKMALVMFDIDHFKRINDTLGHPAGDELLRLLNQLPVDTLKIDRSFVADADRDRRALALVKAIIEMGHALDLEIVAKGVERASQAELLKSLGCDQLKGYLYCRPVEAAQLARWLGEAAATA